MHRQSAGDAAGRVACPKVSKRRAAGFTLMELIVVLFIISITAAVVIPRVGAGWKRLEDGEFLREFTETIKRARLVAMSTGQPTAFRINGSERVFDLVDPPGRPIPQNTEVFSEGLEKDLRTGDFLLTFYPDGSLTGGDIDVVFDHTRVYRVSIHPLFGTVTLGRLESR